MGVAGILNGDAPLPRDPRLTTMAASVAIPVPTDSISAATALTDTQTCEDCREQSNHSYR